MDANLLHISFEGRALEDPSKEPEEDMWRWTVSPEAAPDAPEYLELEYKAGDIVAIDGKPLTPAAVLTRLNELGSKHGIGRLDLVENRYVGMKSRGCYETPGGTHHAEGASSDRVDHPGSRGSASEGRADASLCILDL